jgi:hypothetical protein
MAYWAGPSHHMVQTLEAWAKTVLEASGGNLIIEIDKAPLAKPDGQYDIVKNGVRDLAWHVPGYTIGRFDLFQGPNCRSCARARPCAAPCCGSGTPSTASRPRNSPTPRW